MIEKLELETIIDINEEIYQRSLENDQIEYGSRFEYPILKSNIECLIRYSPDGDLINIASYYLKNIILLQSFPDANHRTALISATLFLIKNGRNLHYSDTDAVEFQKKMYSLRLKTYGHYGSHSVDVLVEERNDVDELCREFIEEHLI